MNKTLRLMSLVSLIAAALFSFHAFDEIKHDEVFVVTAHMGPAFSFPGLGWISDKVRKIDEFFGGIASKSREKSLYKMLYPQKSDDRSRDIARKCGAFDVIHRMVELRLHDKNFFDWDVTENEVKIRRAEPLISEMDKSYFYNRLDDIFKLWYVDKCFQTFKRDFVMLDLEGPVIKVSKDGNLELLRPFAYSRFFERQWRRNVNEFASQLQALDALPNRLPAEKLVLHIDKKSDQDEVWVDIEALDINGNFSRSYNGSVTLKVSGANGSNKITNVILKNGESSSDIEGISDIRIKRDPNANQITLSLENPSPAVGLSAPVNVSN